MQSKHLDVMSTSQADLNEIIVGSGLAEFTRDIKLGKFKRSFLVAKRAIEILNIIVKDNCWKTARELIEALRYICKYVDDQGLVESAVSNMTRRVMMIIRYECQQFSAEQRDNQEENLDSISRDELNDSSLQLGLDNERDVKDNILEAIGTELMNELDSSSKSIAEQAVDYVQSDDIILTLGKSKAIETFLKHAAMGGKTGRRKFSVIVAELAPFYSGHEMAKSLNEKGIDTLIIPDSAVFAIMSRVNKVIISCHSMMANGGIKAPASAHSIALAAKHFAVPFIVCCPIYKLTPQYLVWHDSEALKQFSNLHAAFPEPYVPKTISVRPENRADTDESGESKDVPMDIDAPKVDGGRTASVESLHAIFDYVPPELITLFVSNIGGKSPSYVYQLLNEIYCKTDYLD